ncbi:hypothetical protein RHGRI_023333 [Rhododendron griersonianum]|uniref:Uncharacterized protein n=1 Tax=Rhododendron griersonianum TaxID=479676 RepID=A0AAV6J3D8_9ERIC|nr:hypothetical protein RHGRI_023333 [Rhododendron griersonianum]
MCILSTPFVLIPEGGWKKSPHSMNTPRVYTHAFTTNVVDSKIYVLSGGWRVLQDPQNVPDPKEPGVMFGIDVENDSSSMVPMSVALKCNPKDDSSSMVPMSVALKCNPKDYEWIPQPCPLRKFYWPPQPHFLSVGKGKLAAVYCFTRPDTGHLCVFCSTIKMSKLKDEDGQYQFVASPLRVSDVVLRGMHSEGCIAVFPSQTRGSREDVSKGDNVILAPEDDRKEDNTVSAEEDVSMEDIQFQLKRMSAWGRRQFLLQRMAAATSIRKEESWGRMCSKHR